MFFHGTIQMAIVTALFKEKWIDLKRSSMDCKKSSILNGIAVPFYVSLEFVIKIDVNHVAVSGNQL